ncbi:MAG: hypothetical protein E7310_02060 [Clostridiales bacterium]|nr:hypothetical protein [Clostridiales bacterium]
MKKVIFFILIFIIICFAIPMIFTIKRKTEEASTNIEANKIEEFSYDYAEYSKIKLLHSCTNQVEEISLDEYLIRSCVCRNACRL